MNLFAKTAPAAIVIVSTLASASIGHAADLIEPAAPPYPNVYAGEVIPPVYSGRVSVIDGRTLWFPQFAHKVRLAGIDACELPQWAINPKWTDRQITKAPSPVPCGPLAKAWLKRVIGGKSVSCHVISSDPSDVPLARCTVGGIDLALEMLRVGWARVVSPRVDQAYLAMQQHAMAVRYGMWATYVLDMNEWRRRAVDKTLQRRPIADYDLLVTRRSEISPPFEDLHHKPKRTNR